MDDVKIASFVIKAQPRRGDQDTWGHGQHDPKDEEENSGNSQLEAIEANKTGWPGPNGLSQIQEEFQLWAKEKRGGIGKDHADEERTGGRAREGQIKIIRATKS